MSLKWIAVVLDGTLAKTTTDGSIGQVVKAMAERVKKWHEDGLSVTIFTARPETEWTNIKSWAKTNGLPDLPVTNLLEDDIVELWDSRAIRVEKDTGEACTKCVSSARKAWDHGNFSSMGNGYLRTDC